MYSAGARLTEKGDERDESKVADQQEGWTNCIRNGLKVLCREGEWEHRQ